MSTVRPKGVRPPRDEPAAAHSYSWESVSDSSPQEYRTVRSELDLVFERHLLPDLRGLLLEHGEDLELVRFEHGGLLLAHHRPTELGARAAVVAPITITVPLIARHRRLSIDRVEARKLRDVAHVAQGRAHP